MNLCNIGRWSVRTLHRFTETGDGGHLVNGSATRCKESTMNTYKCPGCGREDVRILAKVSCRPTEEGVEVADDIIKGGGDWACCNDCRWEGTMADLNLSPAQEA